MPMDLRRSCLILLQVSVCPLWASSSPVVTIRALRGSCVVIPCTFTNPEPRTRINFITWDKNIGEYGQLIYRSITYSSHVIEGYRGRTAFVGDLDNNDCSLQINNVRSEDAAEYFPWIDPVTENKMLHKLQVSESPEELSLSDPGMMMTEGRPVLITCSAAHTCPPSPPTLTWDGHSGSASVRHVDLGDGRWRVVAELTYSPVSENHGKSLQCTATYPGNIVSNKFITFNIKYPPKNTTVVLSASNTVMEGDTVTLNCYCAGNPAVFKYNWFEGLQKAPLQNQGPIMTLGNITWDSGPYYCTAKNEMGTGASAPLHLNTQHPPKYTTLAVSGKEILKEGDTVTMICSAVANPAVFKYSWFTGQQKVPLPNQERKMTVQNIARDSGPYYCSAHNKMGIGESAPLDLHNQPLSIEARTNVAGAAIAGVAAGALFTGILLFIFLFLRRRSKRDSAGPRQPPARHAEVQQERVYCSLNQATLSANDEYEDLRRNSKSQSQVGPTTVKKPARPPTGQQELQESVYQTLDPSTQSPSSQYDVLPLNKTVPRVT